MNAFYKIRTLQSTLLRFSALFLFIMCISPVSAQIINGDFENATMENWELLNVGEYEISYPSFGGIYGSYSVKIITGTAGGSRSPLSRVANEIPIPQQKLKDFRLIATEGGVKTWEMEAGAAQIYEKIRKTYIQDFQTSIYEEGKLASILSAQRGILDIATNNMEATGNVVVTSAKGSRLETEELHYLSSTENQKGKFVTEEFVRITEPDRTTTGYGLEIDATLENGKIKRNVKVKVKALSAS